VPHLILPTTSVLWNGESRFTIGARPRRELTTGRQDPRMAKARKTPRSGGTGRKRRRLSRALVAAVDESKIIGVRAGAGSDHRFIGIWAVVVNGRVFARSWTCQPGGWYRTFLEDPLGTIQVGDRQVRIRAVRAQGSRALESIERAYAAKYTTPASRKYVRGFRTPRRRAATMEFRPR
jgi:hypothetical protein